MARIEDYGLIGNTLTAALVSREGSIDWLCLPSFDDDSCFASLIGTPENGYWKIAPKAKPDAVKRAYRNDTTILETTFEAAAGEPSKLQIMYGLRGERRLTELTLPWLAGYENSRPVRIGNDAHRQIQIDVYGELMDTLHVARKFHLEPYDESWALQKAFMTFVEGVWDKPDAGIWEIRGEPQHFTHSKIMAWVAFDRAIKAIEMFGLDGPLER